MALGVHPHKVQGPSVLPRVGHMTYDVGHTGGVYDMDIGRKTNRRRHRSGTLTHRRRMRHGTGDIRHTSVIYAIRHTDPGTCNRHDATREPWHSRHIKCNHRVLMFSRS